MDWLCVSPLPPLSISSNFMFTGQKEVYGNKKTLISIFHLDSRDRFELINWIITRFRMAWSTAEATVVVLVVLVWLTILNIDHDHHRIGLSWYPVTATCSSSLSLHHRVSCVGSFVVLGVQRSLSNLYIYSFYLVARKTETVISRAVQWGADK